MRTFNRLTLYICGLSFAVIAFPGIGMATETITINGSGSALDMMKPMIAAFQKSNKSVRISMDKPLGSSGAVKALLAGALDLVLSSKPLKPEEIAKGAQLQVYGKTPLVIISEKNVRKGNITTTELGDIYFGKTSIWPSGEAIRLVMRPSEDIDSKIIAALSPGMTAAMHAAHSRPGMLVAVTDPEAYTAVSKTPGGLGATGLTSIITEKLPVTSMTLNGITASPQALAKGSYPLAKEISIVTTPKTSRAAQKLISFMHSPQGRSIADKAGVLVTTGQTPPK
jgi:phosphate transport system substrate-binding protein